MFLKGHRLCSSRLLDDKFEHSLWPFISEYILMIYTNETFFTNSVNINRKRKFTLDKCHTICYNVYEYSKISNKL